MCHWMNIRTGEIVKTFWDAMKVEAFDLIHFHFIGIWKYSKQGF